MGVIIGLFYVDDPTAVQVRQAFARSIRRPGDSAEMAFLEFVDYDWKTKAEVQKTDAKKATKKDKDESKTLVKAESKLKKQKFVQAAKDKKVVRKMKQKSRAAMHASN